MNFSKKTQRAVVAFCFLGVACAGVIWHTGWGAISSFGFKDLAVICPLGALETMLARGEVVPRIALAFLGFLAACLVLGRFFCGWVCPVPPLKRLLGRGADIDLPERVVAAPLSDALNQCQENGEAGSRFPSRVSTHKRSIISIRPVEKPAQKVPTTTAKAPYVVLATALVMSFIAGFPVFCLICPVGLTFAVVLGLVTFVTTASASWTLFVFAAMLFVELYVIRRWCHAFCPLGALMALMSRANVFFRPHVNQRTCLKIGRGIDCVRCRQACPEEIDLTKSVPSSQMSRCTKCHACAEACPTGSILFPSLADERRDAVVRHFAKPLTNLAQPASVRRKTFKEIYRLLTLEEVKLEASRCVHCGLCTNACPQGNPISQWMADLAKGEVMRAARKMLRAGSLPEVCARACPRERLCESACVMTRETGTPVAIGPLVRFATEHAFAVGWQPHATRRLGLKRKVAVIGAGPAGLVFADQLARLGALVTVFDRNYRAGGLLTYGIPSFKLNKAALRRRQEKLTRLGVVFRLGTPVDEVLARELLSTHDLVFVATGAVCPVLPTIPGMDALGVYEGLSYLAAIIRRELAEPAAPPDVRDRDVVILGAGGTAFDCARTAVREGARNVRLIARRDEKSLRAPVLDVKLAREEGVEILSLRETVRASVDAGRVVSVEVKNTVTGKTEMIHCDVLITAFGFRSSPPAWLSALGVSIDGQGRVLTQNGCTTNPKVFAGGDICRGSALVVDAIADARLAAKSAAFVLGFEKRHVSRIRKL